MQLNQKIKEKARELGFDRAGIAPAGPSLQRRSLERWLDGGFHAGMAWMERNPGRRSDTSRILPQARSAVSVAISYRTAEPPMEIWNDPLRGRVARFAWGADYHDILTPKLKCLADFIETEAGHGKPSSRFYTDTGPVLERALAQRAGLGHQGFNTNLICPELGSYVLLGEVVTNVEIEPDEASPSAGHLCRDCGKCLATCPSNALPEPFVCDSRRCISYLTIENKGAIPLELRPLLGNWIFGCDECQQCCPQMQMIAEPREHPFLEFKAEIAAPSLPELIEFDEAQFRQRFKGTPIIRSKRRGLLRNVAVALGNSRDPVGLPALEAASKDDDPLIREHARWGMHKLAGS